MGANLPRNNVNVSGICLGKVGKYFGNLGKYWGNVWGPLEIKVKDVVYFKILQYSLWLVCF